MPTALRRRLHSLLELVVAAPGRGIRYLGSFPRPVLLLTLATIIESTGRFMVVPYLSLRMRDEGVALGTLGLVLGAAPIASVLFGAWGGTLSDRWGRKPVQILGVATSGLALIGFAFAGGDPVLLGLLNFLNGMTRTFYRPATNAAIADHCPRERRSEAYALNRIALNMAFGWGPVIGVAIFTVAPQAGFIAGGLLNLCAGLFIALVVPESAPGLRTQAAGQAVTSPRAAWREVLSDRPFWVWTGGMMLIWGAYDLIQSFLPLHLRASDVPLEVYGAALSVNAFVCVFFQLPFSRRLRVAPIAPSAFWSKSGYVLGFLGFAFLRSPLALVIAMFIMSIGEVWGSAVQTRFVPERARPELLGRYQGLSVGSELGRAIVAPAAGFLMQAYGGEAVFVGAAVIAVLGAFLLLVAGRAQDAVTQPKALAEAS